MVRVIVCGLVLLAPAAAPGADLVEPVSKRFASAATDETPDFRRHVVPVLGRLGCNGRACHGSFQGQGGFRLSLFGYDFDADHEALTGGDEPRVDRDDPAESLILLKPTLAIDHGGGRRFDADGWQHRMLLRWVRAGAPAVKPDSADLVSLDVEPREIVFAKAGRTQRLNIVARWSDGTREDVTPLCRFRSNDDSIATIDESGLVTAAGQGDTHAVVFYDNGIVPVPVILPYSAPPRSVARHSVAAVPPRSGGLLKGGPGGVDPRYPDIPTPTKIDELVVAKLRKLGVVPSELSSDAAFLRRASLDVTGTLPTPEEVTAFLADSSPGKRTRKIDELLDTPAYAAWWTTRLCDLTGNTEQNLPIGGEQGVRREKSAQWYDWVHRRVAENVPYDELVERLVLSVSRAPGQSEEEYFAEMSSYFREEDPADFSERETMPYFWTRGRFTPPQPLRFGYAFLGVRLECAECHKHPYDQWTKEDYEGFQAFFDGMRYRHTNRKRTHQLKEELGLTADQDSGGYKRLFAKLAREGNVVPWQELIVSSPAQPRRNAKARKKGKGYAGRVITPKLLGGEQVLLHEYNDRRRPLMDWLREKDNPYFARAFVNRVWAHYFGVGIVDPPDDMNLANPPSNGPLLDYLADEFVAHGYDMMWLHREITTSRTYQLSWRPTETNERDERNFSRALVRRLPAEAAYDALAHATASDESMQEMHEDRAVVRGRAIGVSSGYGRNYDGNYAVNLFGKPPRDGLCDCQRSNEPSLLQTVYLRNDREVLSLLDRKEGWLSQVSRQRDLPASRRDELIREAYLRTLSRPPTDGELEIGRAHVAAADDPAAGLRDLLWALLNTKEFVLNH